MNRDELTGFIIASRKAVDDFNPDVDYQLEKEALVVKGEMIKGWYEITQSIMKLLFKLKKEHRLKASELKMTTSKS